LGGLASGNAATEQDSQATFMVYASSADTCGSTLVGPIRGSEVGECFRSRMHDYQVFIDCGSAWVRQPATNRCTPFVGLSPLHAHLLTIFLIHKDRAIDTLALYSQARSDNAEPRGASSKDVLTDYLYQKVSRFNRAVREVLPDCRVKRDPVADGYRCAGPFSSCVVIPEDTHESYMVECR